MGGTNPCCSIIKFYQLWIVRIYTLQSSLLILLGFISSCAENSNKCSPSYASNIEQLNEKLYDTYANVAVRENNTTSDDIITPENFGGSYVKANKIIVMVKNGSPKGIEDIKKRLGTDLNVTFVSCTYSLQELKELNAKLQVSFAKKAALRDEIGWVAVGIRPIMVKNGSPKGIEDIKKRLGTDLNVTFVSCTYSLQELKELNAKLQVSFAKKAALRDEIGWVAVGIRPIQNRIVVYLNNASNKNISKFKNEICNSDKIIFDQLEIEPIEIQKDTAKDEKVGSPS